MEKIAHPAATVKAPLDACEEPGPAWSTKNTPSKVLQIMSSLDLDPYRHGWQLEQHQPSSPSPTQVAYKGAQASSTQPYYSDAASNPVIAELPAEQAAAPCTFTSEEDAKQDEVLVHRMSQLEVQGSPRTWQSQQWPANPSPTHSPSVSSLPTRRSASVTSSSTQNLATPPLVHQHSTRSLRPHSKSIGTYAQHWSPDSLARVQRIDPASCSTLPEVVVEPFPMSYSDARLASQSLPIPVALDRQSIEQPCATPEPWTLPAYLEKYRQAPYPPQWSRPPVLRTLYAGRSSEHASGSTWLDTPASSTWSTKRHSDKAHQASPPMFCFKFKSTSGGFRSPKLSWTMTCIEPAKDGDTKASKQKASTWTYDLRIDGRTNLRKSESLLRGGPNPQSIMTTYVHALNYDSLRFIGPDEKAYMWVSSTKVSSVDGVRYDTLRHALFVATRGNANPLYGQIVADHCFWDGGVDGSGASLPDEALYLRCSVVDTELVVATLQVMKDWEKHKLREEKRTKPKAFCATEEEARKHALGAASYWKA